METLLVVDDNEENRDMLSRRLERKGFRVLTASGGRQALDLVNSETVDLLLLDVMMPEVSGLDVLREVRSRRGPLDLPVIMVSAATESPQIVEALKLGANDYVTKPVDFPVCLARIQGQLARRQAASAPPVREEFRPAIGALVGPYRLDRQLGEGGMGTVFQAFDTRLERVVALKVVTADPDFDGDEVVQRFLQEARAIARLRHPHVVAIYEVATEPCHYLAMECVEGGTLEDVMAGGAMKPERAVDLALQIADALAAVHRRGIIHRDLKPANVLMDRDGKVRVTDFGLARLVDADLRLTKQGSAVGTPTHMAPEQLDHDFGRVGPQTDLWALGVILYEMLTGELPFKGSGVMQVLNAVLSKDPAPLRDRNPMVPRKLERVVLKALSRMVEERWQTAEEMAEALKSSL